MPGRQLNLGQLPGAEPGDPVDFRDHPARARGGPARKREGLRIVSDADVAARDGPASQILLHLIEQRRDLGVGQRGFGVLRPAVGDQLLEPQAPAADGRLIGRRALEIGPIGRPHDLLQLLTGAGEIAPDRRLRPRRARGPSPQRQPIDLVRVRMVGIVLEPVSELGIAGAVGGRVHVALKEDVAEQDRAVERGDHWIGRGEIARRLEVEDAPIEHHVVLLEGARRRLLRRQRRGVG